MLIKCFKNLATSYPLQVYVEVSKNHNIPLDEVIRGKFRPTIRLLIMYYHHMFQERQKEYEKMEKEQKKNEDKINEMGG